MLIARTQSHLLQELDAMRTSGRTPPRLSLVVVHNQCHEGHGAVINAARTLSDQVIVVLLEDQSAPADNVVTAGEFHDIGFIEQHKADLLYLPQEDQIFPQGIAASCQIHLPTSTDPQGHFSQVLTVQLKLLNLIQPDVYVCGERHYAQLHHTRQMITDLGLQTSLQIIPTVRHADGAAVSPAYNQLTSEQQAQAALLYETLRNTAHALKQGARNFQKVENTARLALRGAGLKDIDYQILDQVTFEPATGDSQQIRILAGAAVDGINLQDNLGMDL